MNFTRLLNASASNGLAQRYRYHFISFPSHHILSFALTNMFCLIFSCLTLSCSRHADKKVSLYHKLDATEFLHKDRIAKQEQLINTRIQVDAPQDVTPVAGVPDEQLRERRVRIFKQAKNAMQSATFDTKNWKVGTKNSICFFCFFFVPKNKFLVNVCFGLKLIDRVRHSRTLGKPVDGLGINR